ncbi:MAG: nucleotidyltransferase domain-containing protein [Proteobacteria bacterium]|nr:nucleotidyltransferase domain-containing protein [Pseudomonadota bacterium]
MFSDPQRAALDRTLAACRGDARIEALLGAGSLVTGGFDAQSDLDFVVVVRADSHAALLGGAKAFAAGLGPLVSAFTGEHVGEPRLLICLYGPPLVHVDLKFVTAADLDGAMERPRVLWARDPAAMERRVATLSLKPGNHEAQWFEDRAWMWLHYSATKLLRGELFEALAALDFFREMVLGPMLRRNAGERARGLRRIEGLAGARDKLVPTVAGYDRAALERAWRATVALYLELRAGDPPPLPAAHMPQALLDFIDRGA